MNFGKLLIVVGECFIPRNLVSSREAGVFVSMREQSVLKSKERYDTRVILSPKLDSVKIE